MAKVFHVPGELGHIDVAELADGGQYVGKFSGKTLAQYQVENPAIVVEDWAVVVAQEETRLTTEPEEITRERFIDMLEVLPPEGWRITGQTESFKMMEYYSGRITSIYARLGNRYFTFRDLGSKTHAEIMDKVAAFVSAEAQS